MRVQVNGAPRELPEGATVKQLLIELGSDRAGVAVAVNGRVVPRSQHADHVLEADARIEVIRAVGGG